ncbi:Collagen Alpha-5(Vi) Chain [Manis pentadactyla]|nr:Collagen Alpha-5(Vi) Chain [Manis pentadactyla]
MVRGGKRAAGTRERGSATLVCLAPAVPPAPNPDSTLPARSSGPSLRQRRGHRHALGVEGHVDPWESGPEGEPGAAV